MPLQYPEPAPLPPGFVLDPSSSSPPYRNAAPQRRALMGPDYGQSFLQQSLTQAPSLQWHPAEDPGLADRLHQGMLRRRQRNAADHALRVADYMHALNHPDSAPEELRPRIPSDPAQHAAARRNADQLYRRLIERTGQFQRELDTIPDSDFLRAWKETDARGAARLALKHPGAFMRDFAAPELVEAVPTALTMAIGGRMAGGIGKYAGLAAEGQRRTALAGAAAVGARDGYEISTSAEMFRQLRERGVDTADPEALGTAFLDRELMAEVMRPARKAGYVGAAAGAASPVLAGKVFAPVAAGPLRRELTNVAAQGSLQSTLSGGASALSEKLVRGQVDWKEVIASAIGPAMLAPLDVATAGAGGYVQRFSRSQAEPRTGGKVSSSPLEEISRRPEEAGKDSKKENAGAQAHAKNDSRVRADIEDHPLRAPPEEAVRQAEIQVLVDQLRYRYLGWNHEQKKFSQAESMAIARAERKLGRKFQRSDVEGVDLLDPTGWGRVSIKGPFLTHDRKPLSETQQRKAIKRIRMSIGKSSAVETHLIDLTGLSDEVKREMREALADAKVRIIYVEE